MQSRPVLRLATGASLLAFAAACATTAPLPVENVRRPMLEDSRGKIASTEVILPIRQKDIYVYAYIPPPPNTVYYSSSGTMEGVIGTALGMALVGAIEGGQNAATRANAEAAAKPLRAALSGFNFDETLQTDLRTAFSQLPWLNADGYRVLKEYTAGHTLGAPTASGRFLVSADYHVTEKADELIVSISPNYYYQERAGGAAASGSASWTDHLFYTNKLSFRMHVPNATTNTRDNVCEWSFGEGAVMRAALAQGSARLTQMLVTDLQDALGGAAEVGAVTPEEVTVDNIKGVVIARDDQGSMVRLESGAKVFLARTPPSAYAVQAGSKPPCGPLPKPAAAKPAPKAQSTKAKSSKRST